MKLYKQSGSKLLYWESWAVDHTVTTHIGVVGFSGKIKEYKLSEKKDPEEYIERLAKRPRRKGYAEIALEDHWTLTIQQKMTGDDISDLDHRNGLIDDLDNLLGWIGAGHVDGGDIGSGTINIYAFVLDPNRIGNDLISWLKQTGELSKSTVAFNDPDETVPATVIWPPDFEGEFSPL